MRVVFAPDSFKGSADAAMVAACLAEGWASVRPDDETLLFPMADGGEGTSDAVRNAVSGAKSIPITVTGPDDRPVDTEWVLMPDGSAVVELARASGLLLLGADSDEDAASRLALRPSTAHTIGLGEIIVDALSHGVPRIFIAIGGSASSDGGAGLLGELGAVIADEHGHPVAAGNDGLARVALVDFAQLLRPPTAGAFIWSDVSNPLLGELGAIAVFGSQKGVTPELAPAMESNLERFADVVEIATGAGLRDAPGAGAAGGAGFGLLAWGATMVSGSRSVADMIGLPAALAASDLVVTGEGRFDAQSARGKVVSAVAELAKAIPLALVAGGIADDVGDSLNGFAASISLSTLAGSSREAMARPEHWLREAGAVLAREFGEADTEHDRHPKHPAGEHQPIEEKQ